MMENLFHHFLASTTVLVLTLDNRKEKFTFIVPSSTHSATGQPKDFDRTAEEAYNCLKWHKQFICYQYWNYKAM
jgi:hypothetical protein